jgi:Na+/H+-dicarboxylate symporter
MAMVLAFVGAFFAIFFSLSWLKALAGNVRDGSTRLLRHLFIPLLPLYVFGFILQLQYSGSFTVLMTTYSKVFLLTILIASLYIGGWYGVVGKLYGLKPLTLVRYMFPPALAGFTTMSSAAAMPVTLEGVEKIVKRREYVNFVVPLTASPHSLGDTLTITVSALALLWMTGAGLPSPGTFAVFSLYFCLCKFSSAGVPGGGIYAVLWVLRDYLGFDTTLCDMITTAYLLQDPFLTAFNVSGNGAFAALTCRLFEKRTGHVRESQTPVEGQAPPSL